LSHPCHRLCFRWLLHGFTLIIFLFVVFGLHMFLLLGISTSTAMSLRIRNVYECVGVRVGVVFIS
jgi:NADH:ubiquinone oxidoreductase subunit 3 (subunit A)